MRAIIGAMVWALVICGVIMYAGIDTYMIREYKKDKSKELFQMIVTIMMFEGLVIAVLGYIGVIMFVG